MKIVTFALVVSLFAGSTAFAQETPPSSGAPDDIKQWSEPKPVALLLPAIQQAREAASKPKPKTAASSSYGNSGSSTSGSQQNFQSNGPAMSRENPEG